MGDQLARAYYACNFTSLSPGAIRVLFRMAATIRDTDSVPGANDAYLYYGGWKSLTVVLGYGITENEESLSGNARRAIARAVRELKAAGLLEVAPKSQQQGHWNRAYHLPPIPTRYYT